MEFSNFRKLLLGDKQSTVEIKEVENGLFKFREMTIEGGFFFFFWPSW